MPYVIEYRLFDPKNDLQPKTDWRIWGSSLTDRWDWAQDALAVQFEKMAEKTSAEYVALEAKHATPPDALLAYARSISGFWRAAAIVRGWRTTVTPKVGNPIPKICQVSTHGAAFRIRRVSRKQVENIDGLDQHRQGQRCPHPDGVQALEGGLPDRHRGEARRPCRRDPSRRRQCHLPTQPKRLGATMHSQYLISLASIRHAGPHEEVWTKLLDSLGRPAQPTWPKTCVTLGDVAASSGAAGALWCAKLLPNEARPDLMRSILPSVKRAAAHTSDVLVHAYIIAIERWIDGGGWMSHEDMMAAAEKAAVLATTTWAETWEAGWAAAEAAAIADAAWTAARATEMDAAALAATEAIKAVAALAKWLKAVAALAKWSADTATEHDQQVSEVIAVFGRMHGR